VSAVRVGTLALVVALGNAACGSETPPVCPTGSCELPGSTVVKWHFNNYPAWMFDSDACSDLSVFQVKVDVVGIDDPTQVATMTKGCGEGQLTFLDLAPGTYGVDVTPLDINGDAAVGAPTHGEVLAGSSGANTEVTIGVPYTAWLGPYTGTFLFRLTWGGMGCSAAAVTTQVLTLTAGGTVVTAVTDTNQKVDGTDPKGCRDVAEMFPQFVEGVPFGPATLEVTGQNGGGMPIFHGTFSTFIGAGKFNPTLTFDAAAM